MPKTHFEGKENGYYYIIHVNDLNENSTFYEIHPFKVILNEEYIYLYNSKWKFMKIII